MNPVNKMELNHAVICELTNVMHILLCIYIYIYICCFDILLYIYIYCFDFRMGSDRTNFTLANGSLIVPQTPRCEYCRDVSRDRADKRGASMSPP